MEGAVEIVNKIVWSPALVVLLISAGLYFTVRTRCVQVRKLPQMIRLLFKDGRNNSGEESLSSFQAFWLALSGRVGTGNIVGVATAIAIGGPGAVFWMWVIAFFGASTAFTESALANKYKFWHNGVLRGGPAEYISKGLHSPFLGGVFAVLTILGYGMLCMLVQTNSISRAFENAFSIAPLYSGIGIALILGMVIIGGVSRIAKVAEIVTPFIAVSYILISIIIIIINIENVPHIFAQIFSSAFGLNQAFGGIFGSAIAVGVKRGLFSNEAGQGGGAIVSGSSNTDHPAKQGLVQAFSVYIDTIIVCTATALMILSTGCYNVFDASGNVILESAPELGNNYVSYTQSAIDTVFSGFGSYFVAIALAFFAFTTLLAFYFYAESSFSYLFRQQNRLGPKREKAIIRVYQIIVLAIIVGGAITSSDTVWKMGDIGVGLTAWINVVVLIILFPEALALLKDFEKKQ